MSQQEFTIPDDLRQRPPIPPDDDKLGDALGPWDEEPAHETETIEPAEPLDLSGVTVEAPDGPPGIAKLAAKIAAVMGEVGRIPKRGKNTFHGYNYATEGDIADAVRHLLSTLRVAVLCSIEDVRRVQVPQSKKQLGDGKAPEFLTIVRTRHTFIDGESGAQISIPFAGSGVDASDKGLYKAVTGAMKYFLMKNFLVSTGDDPERHDGNPRETRRDAQPPRNSSGAPGGAPDPEVLKKQVVGLMREAMFPEVRAANDMTAKQREAMSEEFKRVTKAALGKEYASFNDLSVVELALLRDAIKDGRVTIASRAHA